MKKIILSVASILAVTTLTACAPATMSTEAAGRKYLEIVCPGNTEMNAYVTAMLGNNLDMIQKTATSLKKEYVAEIEEIKAAEGSWPQGIQEHVTVISDANEAVIEVLDKVATAKTLEDAKIELPELPGISEAVKTIRSELGLPANSQESCKSITE